MGCLINGLNAERLQRIECFSVEKAFNVFCFAAGCFFVFWADEVGTGVLM